MDYVLILFFIQYLTMILSPKSSDFIGYPKAEYTYTRTQEFQKNNCSPGQYGSTVPFSKVYTSYISDEDAEGKASSDPNFISEGQANANSAGSCSTTCIPVNRNIRGALIGINSENAYMRRGFLGNYTSEISRFSKSEFAAYIGSGINPPSGGAISNQEALIGASDPLPTDIFLKTTRSGNNIIFEEFSMATACTHSIARSTTVSHPNMYGGNFSFNVKYLYRGTGHGMNGILYTIATVSGGTRELHVYFLSSLSSIPKLVGVCYAPNNYSYISQGLNYTSMAASYSNIISFAVISRRGSHERIQVFRINQNAFDEPNSVTQIMEQYSDGYIELGPTCILRNTTIAINYSRNRFVTIGPETLPTLRTSSLYRTQTLVYDYALDYVYASFVGNNHTPAGISRIIPGANSWSTRIF